MATSAAAKAVQEGQSAATIKVENTAKRDFLVKLEKQYQAKWKKERIFEVDSPGYEDPSLRTLSRAELHKRYPKHFGTFPYAYMNGSLHLGHGFSISKLEFASGYERMLGKRVLFPNAYHCTGMPIKAASDKLIREMELFGQDFERFVEEDMDDTSQSKDQTVPVHPNPASKADAVAPTTSTTSTNVDKSKKGKLAAKSTGLKYQFQIMESIGVPRAEIKKFADPDHWLHYFPPIAEADLTALGARIDWRRQFVTTDVNPYYDSFVRWQMNRLRALDYIKYGERYTIFSPKDGQPCMDHDRQSGEGIGPQEYTGLRMELTEWSPTALQKLGQSVKGRRVFFIAATLRPETMYGQTNCFVGKSLQYGLFAAPNDQLYLCTLRSARNMAYQGLLKDRGRYEQVAEVQGSDLIGSRIRAPLSKYGEVYILPMEGVLANKGTGVVTSVPSDSPDDYQTLMDLRKKPEFYGIDPIWAANDPVPVLSTSKYGDMSAPVLVKQLKVQSQKDKAALAEAKELAYKEGFYHGVMSVGDFKGERVEVAKNKVRDQMIAAGDAFIYSEPEGLVMSRSADECVVALCDQWYMAYGESKWQARASELLRRMNTFDGPKGPTRSAFEGVLDWLHEWACSRSYGLGSRIPWDQQFLVESLSDSTIYMSYYTFAHLLQGDLYGQKPGLLDVKPEQLTDEVWDYIFRRSESLPTHSPLPKDKADVLRGEFEYFYPMDMRTSGKDLIGNHLTFCIYVHSALFGEEDWPRSMRCNGHLLLNGEKMSKSTGNSLTLRDAIQKFGADATRLTLADSGDGIDDANFVEEVASSASERLWELVHWSQETYDARDSLRTGAADSFFDRAFAAEIDKAIIESRAAYESANYKEALKVGYHEFLNARREYRKATEKDQGMHRDLILRFIKTQALLVTPIASHYAEHVWTTILGEAKSVQHALFPEPSAPLNLPVLRQVAYLREDVVKTIRDAEIAQAKKAKKGGAKNGIKTYDPSAPASQRAVRIFVAQQFPVWQERVLHVLQELRATSADVTPKAIKEALTTLDDGNFLKKEKKAMPFAAAQAALAASEGDHVLSRSIPFDEYAFLCDLKPYLRRELGFGDIEVVTVDVARQQTGSGSDGWTLGIIEQAEPLQPTFEFTNTRV